VPVSPVIRTFSSVGAACISFSIAYTKKLTKMTWKTKKI